MSEAPDTAPVEAEAPPELIVPVEGTTILTEGTSSETAPAGTDTLAGASGNDSISGEITASPVEFTEFALPEGASVDPAALDTFKEFALTSKLSQEQAQAALDLHFKLQAEAAKTFADSAASTYADMVQTWRTEVETDPEFAGARMATALTVIGRSMDTYGTPDLKAAFELTGAGNHPAIIKYVHSMAKQLDEGRPIPAGGPPRQPKTLAETLYPPKES